MKGGNLKLGGRLRQQRGRTAVSMCARRDALSASLILDRSRGIFRSGETAAGCVSDRNYMLASRGGARRRRRKRASLLDGGYGTAIRVRDPRHPAHRALMFAVRATAGRQLRLATRRESRSELSKARNPQKNDRKQSAHRPIVLRQTTRHRSAVPEQHHCA